MSTIAHGSDLSPWWLTLDTERRRALECAKLAGHRRIVGDSKDGNGLLAYPSAKWRTLTAYGPEGGMRALARDATAYGVATTARFDCFQDREAFNAFTDARIPGADPEAPWVDPTHPTIRARLLDMIREHARVVPVAELCLDHVRFPVSWEGSPKTPEGSARIDAITSFVRDAVAAAKMERPGLVVSASVLGWTMREPMRNSGQDVARLLGAGLDFVRPMLYPSFYSSTADPYRTVRDETARGVAKFGASRVRPWVQGFDKWNTTDAIGAQLRGARDAGAPEALVWWFPSVGLDSARWQRIAAKAA